MRVIHALQELMPISHSVILSPADLRESSYNRSAARLRQQLIDTYGEIEPDGSRRAVCAYCLATEGRIEVEHVVPLSRGGTDGWQNRVLSCAGCNARKRDQLPEEAGMSLRIPLAPMPAVPNRAGSYARSTARLLIESLSAAGIQIRTHREAAAPDDQCPGEVYNALLNIGETSSLFFCVIAKPIARPTKQVFTGRNYPLTTPLRPGLVRLRQTVRKRVRVNQGLAMTIKGDHRVFQVISSGEAAPKHVAQMITLGMLCEAKYRTQPVTGIVAAIHSTGRLTLLLPDGKNTLGVDWRRVVVSSRKFLRVLSNDPVIFISAPAKIAG